jgi:DNA processing protein
MSPDAVARLRLSLAVEGGDPALRRVLRSSTPVEVTERLDAGDVTLPDRWHDKWPHGMAVLDAALARAGQAKLSWLTPGHAQWPDRLNDLVDAEELNGSAGAPLGLWVRGSGRLPELLAQSIAIVGARHCSTYGAEAAGDIAADCADAGMTLVSGAAFGIDACAHRGAMLAGAPSIAVLAGGADVDYPKAHAALLSRIGEDGLVLSEQPPGASPQRQRFLSRNRIIAALGAGTVVVEAARRSGSLNTLHWADGLSRAAMVVPGPVTSQLSTGCHVALRSGRAVLVTNAADVFNELYGLEADESTGLSVASRRVWQIVSKEPQSVVKIAQLARMTTREVLHGCAALQKAGLLSEADEGWRRAG